MRETVFYCGVGHCPTCLLATQQNSTLVNTVVPVHMTYALIHLTLVRSVSDAIKSKRSQQYVYVTL